MPLQEAIGKGTVQVVKNHPDWPNPYNGITAIRSGEVDRDVGAYLAESEQRACALAAASSFNGILCTSAGGYIVEQLPGCTPETATQVEKNLAKLVENDGTKSIPTGILLNGGTPLDICSLVLDGLEMKPLQQTEAKQVCGCSGERLFRALRLLPREDVDDIIAKQEQIEARCEFCGKVYQMSSEEVAAKFATATGDPALDQDNF
jgi:molecular chaperone Hsp33